MPRPGVEIVTLDQPTPPQVPTGTGAWFVVGVTSTTPSDSGGNPVPTLVRSLAGYEAAFGARSGASIPLYDAVDVFFHEGGSRVWVSALHSGAVTAPDWAAALDRFVVGLGPGQVSAPGSEDPAIQEMLLDHAAAHNRVALIDGPLSGTADSLVAAGAALQTSDNARYGAMFAPWGVVPGLAPGTTREVGWAAIEAGIIARNDSTLNPNVAAAGVNGQSVYAIDLTARYSDVEYEAINTGSVCMARDRFGRLQTYGYRSLVDPDVTPQWLDFGWARLNMAIIAQAEAVAEAYVFSQIDGRGKRIAQFGGELRAILVPFYEAGALYGATAEDAFQVDVGGAVNTAETIANGELHAQLKVRMSPFAELVVIEIVKVPTTVAIAA